MKPIYVKALIMAICFICAAWVTVYGWWPIGIMFLIVGSDVTTTGEDE